MFDVQAIPDTKDVKYQHLNPFGACWLQELPVEHTIVHQNNKYTWER